MKSENLLQTGSSRSNRLRAIFDQGAFRNRILQICACAFTALSVLGTHSATAAPADSIRRAVAAGGAAKVETATPQQFVRAFTAVLIRTPEQDRPQYVTIAIKLRPEFAAQITAAALRAHASAVRDSCDWASSIIRAAIAAAPNEKGAIVRAALEAEPAARECILAAAGLQNQDSLSGWSLRPSGVDAGSVNSSAIGTINPGNLSAQGNEVSPSRP